MIELAEAPLEPILAAPDLVVPADALAFRAVRAGGPGGQNVNKVSTKVELRVDLDRVQGLDEAARARLLARIHGRLDADGRWIVVSSLTRDLTRNLEDAREKIRRALLAAREAPRPRTATRPTRASQVRRVEAKKARGQRKQLRGRPDAD